MLHILGTDVWSTLSDLARKAVRKHAAVAYVTSDKQVSFGSGDVLITDASDDAIIAGRTSARILKSAFKRGAHLYSLEHLHAKILCLDRVVVVGSANLSLASVTSLVEAAAVTDHPSAVAEARALVARIREAATPIDEDFLRRIERLPVERRTRSGTRRPMLELDRPSRAWLVGVHAIDDGRHAGEASWVATGEAVAQRIADSPTDELSWLRFTGASKFRREATRGDTVIQIWREHRKHKTAHVFFAVPILHRQDEPSCTRFFVSEPAQAAGRAISWGQFRRIWVNSGGGEVPPLVATRQLSRDLAERIVAAWPS